MATDRFELEGTVIDVLKGGKFVVKLENDMICTCTISGKMRQNFIKIIKGDDVTVDISQYDVSKGRIIWRGRS